jgi:hypothetical protein
MTKQTANNLLLVGFVALSATFIFLYIRGRKVFNRELAADAIDKFVGRNIIDRKNVNQDSYLFAWWYAITRKQPTFIHGSNVFSVKTGDFIRD